MGIGMGNSSDGACEIGVLIVRWQEWVSEWSGVERRGRRSVCLKVGSGSSCRCHDLVF